MNQQERSKQYRRRIRNQCLLLIDPKLKCSRCGCDNLLLLEINHINGGGTRELKDSTWSGMKIPMDVVKGRRSVEDLELLCKPCNAIHYLELKFQKPLPMQVVWTGNKTQ